MCKTYVVCAVCGGNKVMARKKLGQWRKNWDVIKIAGRVGRRNGALTYDMKKEHQNTSLRRHIKPVARAYQVLPTFNKFFQLQPTSANFYQVLLTFAQFCQLSPTFACLCQILPGFYLNRIFKLQVCTSGSQCLNRKQQNISFIFFNTLQWYNWNSRLVLQSEKLFFKLGLKICVLDLYVFFFDQPRYLTITLPTF